ncbi:MAG: hypothetical protein ACOX7P_08635 [Oscillospiraceae bacterium]|jgi:hypothetical protein
MRRRIGALMMTLLVLTGCGREKAIDQAHRLQSELARINGCKMEAEVHADYGDRTQDFVLRYELDESEGLITVLAPEIIEGLAVSLKGDELEMLINDVRLETGKLDPEGLTPISALPVMLRAWREMPILSAGREKHEGADALIITFGPETEKPAHCLRFDVENGMPLTAEIYSGGRAVITCRFTDFEITQFE